MRLDEQHPSLFASTPAAPTSSSSSEDRGERDGGDDLATQPIADLPLFPRQPSEEAAAERRTSESPDLREPSAEQATRPVPAPAREKPPTTASGPAPIGRRLAASCLDAVALLAVLGLLIGISALMGVAVEPVDLLLFLPTWLAFGFFYQVLPLLFWGRTPGMSLAGIESRDRDGAPLSLEQAAQRWLGGLVTWLLLGLPGTLALTGRSLVDRLSHSRTVPSP